MFAKDDFIDFFNQISELEDKMSAHADELSRHIEDEDLSKLVIEIKTDELRHKGILKEIKELVLK